MMKLIRIISAVCLLIPCTYTNATAADNIAVLEVFSTISCPDTKLVDDIFHDIALGKHKNLITLNCHTTTLDNDAKDPLANEFCDYRQNSYDSILGKNPVIILNGYLNTNGRHKNVIYDGLALAHSLDEIRPIQLTLTRTSLQISLPKLNLENPARIWLIAYEKLHPLYITEGLLKGTTMDYVDVVKSGQKLIDKWQGQYRNLDIPTDLYPGDGYVVLAQSAIDMKIIAAGKIENQNIKDPDQP